MSDYFLLTDQIVRLREYSRCGKPWAIEARVKIERLSSDAKELGLDGTSLVEDLDLALEYIRNVERSFYRVIEARIEVLEAARNEARKVA